MQTLQSNFAKNNLSRTPCKGAEWTNFLRQSLCHAYRCSCRAERCIFYDYAIDDGHIVMLGNASAFLFAMLGTFCLMVTRRLERDERGPTKIEFS